MTKPEATVSISTCFFALERQGKTPFSHIWKAGTIQSLVEILLK